MNAARYLIPIALIAAAYFLFFASNLPGEIEFRGHTLGPRTPVENNSTREFDIYSYSDGSRNHMLLFVMSTAASPTSQELLEFYIANFKAQGYSFRSDEDRHLGTKGEEVIYMTRAPGIDSAVAYIQKSADAPTSLREASDIFSELKRYSFD